MPASPFLSAGRLRTGIGALLLLIACTDAPASTQPGPRSPPGSLPIAAAAEAHLTEVLDVMQTHSLRRRTIDWPAFRASVFAAAGTAQTVASTYPAIRVALGLLGDGHSSYRSATGTVLFVPNRACTSSGAPVPNDVPADIGYVRVRGFSGSAAEARAFADGLQATIRAADHDSLRGWIVDLRGNGGGNMWPMLAGVGPVLGTGVVGWFIDPDGRELAWEYRDGASWNGGIEVQRVTTPYSLRRPDPKVAVLVDNGVASSGEATFIAFRGRANTRSFGVATCGVSTANTGFRMSDGALLNLTVSAMADRGRVTYGEQVAPDELVSGPAAVVARAVAWLRGD